MRLTDVVKNLIIINVIFFLATTVFMPQIRDWLIFHYPGAVSRSGSDFQPYQIITHMFMHAYDGRSLFSMHLFFNMIGLYFFGPPLETLWGPKRFLFYYLFAGLGALALHVLINFIEIQNGTGYPGRVLGASGAVMGLMVGFAYYFPNQKISLLFPPITLPAKHMVMAALALDLGLGLFGGSLFGSGGTGIAHFAHLGGALFGFLLILYWRKFGSRL